MLVRGASATPEGTPVVSTPPAARKRKHAASEEDGETSTLQPTDPSNVVLAHDTSRPRLTVSRHPIFALCPDGSPFYYTEVSAVNRQLDKRGFKYAPAGLAEPGAAIPYRTIESRPMCTRVSWEDRSPTVKVTQDGFGLAGDKGFRSARTNVGVQEGKWYMEVKIEKGGGEPSGEEGSIDGAHVRLGWGRREAPLNGPVGLDGYSYGMRDKTGDKVTLSRPRPYGRPFTTGDVVGLYISLPPRRQPNPKDPDDPAHIHRERIPIDLKGQEYFESLDYPQIKEMLSLMDHPSKMAKTEPTHQTKKSATVKNLPSERARSKPIVHKVVPQRPLPILPGSKIAFFINDECQGVAFQEIYDFLQLPLAPDAKKAKEKQRRNKDGPLEHVENNFDDGTLGYYPFFSLFGGAQIRLNPGPHFAFPPPPDIDALLTSTPQSSQERTWRPMSERYPEFITQQWALDAQEENAHKVKTETDEALEALEEKKRAQRERKRKTEAARRKRKAEEKKAEEKKAAAVASISGTTATPGYVVEPHVYETGATPGLASSPAPSVAPSAIVYADVEDALLASVGFAVTPTPTPTAVVDESLETQESDFQEVPPGISVPQTPQSSDYGGPMQQDDWQSEGQSDDEQNNTREHDQDGDPTDQQIDEELLELAPSPQAVGFQESSTRWVES